MQVTDGITEAREHSLPKGQLVLDGIGLGLLLGCLMTCLVGDSSLALSLSRSDFRGFMVAGFAGALAHCIVTIACWVRRRHGRSAQGAQSQGAPRARTVDANKSRSVRGKRGFGGSSVEGAEPAGPLVPFAPWVSGVLILAVFALLGSIPGGFLSEQPMWTGCLGAIAGFSGASLFLRWADVFSQLGFKTLALTAACSLGAAVPYLVISLLLPSGAAALLNGVAGAASACLLGVRLKRGEAPVDARTDAPAVPPTLSPAALARELWRPLALAAIVSWALGMIWDVSLDPLSACDITPFDWSFLAGQLVAAAMCLLLARVGSTAFSSAICTLVLPLMAALLSVLPSLAGEVFVPVSFAFNLLAWACHSTLFLLLWVLLAHSAANDVAQATTLFAAAATPCLAAVVAGLALRLVVGKAGQVVTLVLLVAYLVASTALPNGAARRPEQPDGEQTSPVDRTSLRCDQLSGEYGLSPREGEVLALLGRGFSQAYIAAELQVSESTIHTHARKIYGKLGVSSRSELIALINSEEHA